MLERICCNFQNHLLFTYDPLNLPLQLWEEGRVWKEECQAVIRLQSSAGLSSRLLEQRRLRNEDGSAEESGHVCEAATRLQRVNRILCLRPQKTMLTVYQVHLIEFPEMWWNLPVKTYWFVTGFCLPTSSYSPIPFPLLHLFTSSPLSSSFFPCNLC